MKRWSIVATVGAVALVGTLIAGLRISAQGNGETAGLGWSRGVSAEPMADALSRDAVANALSGDAVAGALAGDVVTSSFTYQAVLKEGEQLVDGTRDMTFRLYADEGCAAMVGSPVNRMVAVNDGLFDASLAFDPGLYSGQALWLETEVAGTVIGCQLIQTVPYASGLRPGATISSAVGADQDLSNSEYDPMASEEGCSESHSGGERVWNSAPEEDLERRTLLHGL